MIRRAFLVLACSTLVPVLAWAGPNAGGTIIVHDANFIVDTDYSTCCGLGTPPATCELADVNLEGSTFSAQKLWKVYAAFADGSSPRLKAMCFGVHYEQQNAIITMFGPCVGDLNNGGGELSGPGWPGSDTGTAIVFQDTQTTQLVECYYFVGYNYYGTPSIFQLRDHPDPVLGGKFADDSIPSIQDPIAGYGSMGFDRPGEVVCPHGGLGACCLCDGTCLEITETECNDQQGMWIPDIPCDPNPCPAPMPGACCYPDGHCEYVCDWQCPTGDWHEGVPCEPENPCLPPNPTRNTTWGGIKSIFH